MRRYRAGVPRTVICPYCFEEFPLEKMLFASFADEEVAAVQYTWLERLLRRPLKSPRSKQGQRLTRKLCPNKHDLPYTAGTQASLVFPVIGAPSSGISTYIVSLIERLESQVGTDMMAALNPANEQTAERYRDEFRHLFEDHHCLPRTIGAQPPLLFDLVMDARLFRERGYRAVILILYDTARNDTFLDEIMETRQRLAACFRAMSGSIFLLDPLEMPEIRDMLPSTTHLPTPHQIVYQFEVIHRFLQLLQEWNVWALGAPFSTPVAFVLTKCDVLRDAGLIDTSRLWSTSKRHVGYFDRAMHEDMSGMWSEYLQRWSPVTYNTVTTRFSHYAFFGASATGCSPESGGRYPFISPWRVEDPLLWLLAELGVIPVR